MLGTPASLSLLQSFSSWKRKTLPDTHLWGFLWPLFLLQKLILSSPGQNCNFSETMAHLKEKFSRRMTHLFSGALALFSEKFSLVIGYHEFSTFIKVFWKEEVKGVYRCGQGSSQEIRLCIQETFSIFKQLSKRRSSLPQSEFSWYYTSSLPSHCSPRITPFHHGRVLIEV